MLDKQQTKQQQLHLLGSNKFHSMCKLTTRKFKKQEYEQNGPKTTSLMMSLTKNPQPPTKKFFSSAD